MSKAALIIIYNHQYNKNIEVLNRIYQDRFSAIFHLVPFYEGDDPNVIPVYENSHYFQGYVAQGFRHFVNQGFDHYFFIADDLILNPVINEHNYAEYLKLTRHSCFLPHVITLHDDKDLWGRVRDAYRYNINIHGVEAKPQLPAYDEALQRLSEKGFEIEPISYSRIWKEPASIKEWRILMRWDKNFLKRYLKNKFKAQKYPLKYPMIASYSDIFVVSSDVIRKFCHYCGVFAATNLFVEIGLPTSMALCARDIVTEKDLELRGKALWPDGWARMNGDPLRAKGDFEELTKYDHKLKRLLEDFPETYMYLHPIKLSEWNTEL